MSIYDIAPVRALITAAAWLVTQVSDALSPVAGPASAALAIVLVTMTVRAALVPVGLSQARAALARQRLAPRLAQLQRRYASQPEVLRREIGRLYATERVSPLAGCLPALAQAPVLTAVYGVFVVPTVAGHANALLSHALLGVPLGTRLVGLLTTGAATWPGVAVPLALVCLVAAVAEISRRLLPAVTAGAGTAAGVARLASVLPFTTAVVAAVVPLAAALYLATTTVWTLGERLVLRRVLGTSATSNV